MKLVPINDKVQIKWFVYSMGQKLPRTASMRGAWDGYDFECSCGFKSNTQQIKSRVLELVENHKRFDHGYSWKLSKKVEA
jgi:hypothetical protein